MKKILKKNQVIITALALMIAVAGYLSYTDRTMEDETVAKEVSAELTGEDYQVADDGTYDISEEGIFTAEEDASLSEAAVTGETGETTVTGETAVTGDTAEEAADLTAGDGAETASAEDGAQNAGEAVLTGTEVANVDYAADVKLSREQVRAQNKETLLDIINNESIDEASKQNAINEMISLTDMAEKENEAELLLEAKGFTDVVVSMSDASVDVVLDMGEVTDAKRAQVEDIVKRKTGVSAESIVITPIAVADTE